MRNVFLLTLVLSAPWPGVPLLAARAASAQPVIAVVAALSGTASVTPAQGGATTPLQLRQQVREGAAVQTGPASRLRLDLLDGTALTLGEQTSIRLDHLARPDDTLSTRISHTIGILRALVAPQHRPAGLEIVTATVVAAVRGTEWIQQTRPGTTDVFVRAGEVALRVPDLPEGAPVLPPAVTLTPGEGVTFESAPTSNVPPSAAVRALRPLGRPVITHTPVAQWPAAKIAAFEAATRLP